jgi:nucleoid-associated protein YgaU
VGASAKKMAFMYLKPERLELDLILDGTGTADYGLAGALPGVAGALAGAIGQLTGKGVAGKVEALREEAMGLNSATHEPAFLKVMWGPLDFDCRMEKMTVKYTLFDRSGIPLRAELAVVLNHDIDGKRRVRLDKLNSPDLTHTRVVTAGDTLPMLAGEIYGDPAQYLNLARANGLNNFRKLEVGSTLRFPPLTT